MPNPYGTGIGSLYGYGNGIYPGLGGGLGSMIGYPGYGMGSGMGYGGFGLPGYGGGGLSPYGPMDYSSVYSGSTLGSPWNPYGSMIGGFGTEPSLGSLVRPFTARQKESSSKATVKQ
uniref:Glycine rich superfamily member n=1 Tax=Ascaris lumbricoides TaxID=6252 RepID=A0A0M3HGU5_ASCLU